MGGNGEAGVQAIQPGCAVASAAAAVSGPAAPPGRAAALSALLPLHLVSSLPSQTVIRIRDWSTTVARLAWE